MVSNMMPDCSSQFETGPRRANAIRARISSLQSSMKRTLSAIVAAAGLTAAVLAQTPDPLEQGFRTRPTPRARARGGIGR
jgi:hypothetical protein